MGSAATSSTRPAPSTRSQLSTRPQTSTMTQPSTRTTSSLVVDQPRGQTLQTCQGRCHCCGKRIRTMCRHVSQGAAQKQQPNWCLQIFGSQGAIAGASASSSAAPSAAVMAACANKDEVEYINGCAARKERAYQEGPSVRRELAKPFAKDGAALHDSACALWDDGDEHEIAEFRLQT